MAGKEKLDLSVFAGRRILVTGHTGFKGSWLSFMLNELGAEVAGLSIDKPSNLQHAYYALGLSDIIVNAGKDIGDVRSFEVYSSVYDQFSPHFVFHLAAQAIVSTSYEDPAKTFSTNIMGVMNALELIRLDKTKPTAVIVTSDKCYKNKEQFDPYSEDAEMGGKDPYSASKGAAELVFQSYLTSFFNNDEMSHVASARAGNVFGGGDWSANRLVPDCMRDIFSSGTVNIRMPTAVRPWTFVIDILFGYILLAARLRQDRSLQGSWNFASGETMTVKELCEVLIAKLGHGSVVVDPGMMVGKESGILLIDPSKARHELGWFPQAGLDQALANTAAWYSRQRSGDDMRFYSAEFVRKYFDEILQT